MRNMSHVLTRTSMTIHKGNRLQEKTYVNKGKIIKGKHIGKIGVREKFVTQSMLQEQYSLSWTPIVTDTPSPLFQKPFLQLKEIMKSTIENCWLLFEHSKNGVIIFKDLPIQQ